MTAHLDCVQTASRTASAAPVGPGLGGEPIGDGRRTGSPGHDLSGGLGFVAWHGRRFTAIAVDASEW